MKKSHIFLVLLALLVSAVSCSRAPEKTQMQLVNKMSATELDRVDKHGFTLLDEPEIMDAVTDFNAKKHTVQIEMTTVTKDDLFLDLQNMRDDITEEQYREAEEYYESLPEDYSDTYPVNYLVDGNYLFEAVPFTGNYDGGVIQFTQSYYDDSGEMILENIECTNPEAYYEWLKDDLVRREGKSEAEADRTICKVRLAYESYLSGNYDTLPEGSVDRTDSSIGDNGNINEYNDYRDQWEYDYNSVKAISDSIEEISIYDEEMDIDFLVHVVLPPNYDPNKTYPVFLLTDGVWRFGNTPELRQVMEDGKAEDVILVTLGYGYHMNGSDESNRVAHLVMQRAALLDFITDNLMPYLGENYNIDYSSSTLYGHSDGGVFTHYALFNSDRYENQPFGHYIIGSPAFWCLYGEPELLDVQGYESDYGYFERNTTLEKSVFLCGGSLEDPDYADQYHGHNTTLEGLEALKEKLESYEADVTYRLYESHHYQYIPEMLVEYLKETY